MCVENASWKVGMKASFTKTIAESDVYLFAGITGDFNSAHVNAVAANNTIFGERIVHGILVTGLISATIGMKLPGEGTIYIEQDSKFLRPAKIGDTLTANIEIIEIINEEKRILKLDTNVQNERSENIIEGYAIVKAPIR